MNNRHRLAVFLLITLGVLTLACEKHILEKEVSLEDAAKMLIEESTLGKSIYGGGFASTDTVDTDGLARPNAVSGWVAHWDFLEHTYSITFDTVIDREVSFRAAIMTIRDSVPVRLTLLRDTDSALHKVSFAKTQTSALLVQLGSYGYLYHGWVLRKIAHRRFRGPSATPSIISVTVQYANTSRVLSEAAFSIDSVPRITGGKDSITVRVRTYEASDRVFLNIGDSGPRYRVPMTYNTQSSEFLGGWRVPQAAATGRYYQAFVEVYTKETFTSTNKAKIGVSGQTFVYRIQ